jgi:hypothetical protein
MHQYFVGVALESQYCQAQYFAGTTFLNGFEQ